MASKKRRAARVEDVYALRNVSHPRISPDGKQVAYVVTAADREADRHGSAIWIASLEGTSAARAFTAGSHSHTPRWSPDGTRLAFLQNRGKGTQLSVARLDGGEPRPLTQKGSVSEPVWSPDGKSIAFVRSVGGNKKGNDALPAERNAPLVVRDLYYHFDGVGLYDARRRHIFAIDVASGEERQITDGDWHDSQPAWSPDGRQLVFLSDRSANRWNQLWRTDVWLVAARGGKPRRLTRGRGAASQPTFSPNGSWIAFAGHEDGNNYVARNTHLMVLPSRGRGAPRSLTAAEDLSVAGAPVAMAGRTFEWRPDGSGLVFLAGERGAMPIWSVELASGAVKKLHSADRQASALSLAPDGRRIAFTGSWSSELPELFVAELKRGGAARRISDANKDLRAELELAKTRRMTYRTDDGLEIEAFVLYPPGYRKGRRYPLILNIHGGPQGAHPQAFNPIHPQSWAAAGYVVLLPNPRGSTTYGEAFSMACVGDWGGGDYRDLMRGVDVLVERKIADPERLFVSGYSYGGYMSSWIVGQTNRFRAAAIGAPITNLVSSFGNDDIPHVTIDEMGGTPFSVPDEYMKRSPLTYLANVRTPVLLQHWEGDRRCPIGQSEEFFVGLKTLGKKVEFVRYPGGSHGGRTPSQDVDATRRMLDWFARHTPRKRG
jgi:dipeptidyl aminopeptidase/acylaminoacyl peptidase